MSAARVPAARPRGLALVRGGLGAHGGGGDDDWERFCRRIGWQTDAPEPDAGFEERIAEGLLARAIAPDNVVDLEAAREARHAGSLGVDPAFAQEIRRSFVREIQASLDEEPPISGERPVREAGSDALRISGVHAACRVEEAAQAVFAPDAENERPRRGWRRGGAVAATLALAAGVLLAVTRLTTSAHAPAASIAAPSAEIAHAVTARPQVDAPPPEVPPVRVAPTDSPTAKPAPSPPRPRPHGAKPEPPGALVARRSAEPAKDAPLAAEPPAAPGSREGEPAKQEPSTLAATEMTETDARLAVASLEAPLAEPRAAWPGAGVQADPAASWGPAVRSRIALSNADGVAPVKDSAAAGVWSSGIAVADPVGTERGRATGASWSLTGAKDRWVGASLTPAPSLAQASVGVMVQLDVGKALGKL